MSTTWILACFVCLSLASAVSRQDSNDTKAFRVGETATLYCTGVLYDGLNKHWEKNPEIPMKVLVSIETPLGQPSHGPVVYNESNIAAAGLTGRFMVTDDLMTATITDVRETDDGDYRCASGPSEIIHKLVAYKLNSVRIQPAGPATGYVGGTFDVTCTADSKPAASFNWTKQGDSSFTATGSTLRISNLNMNDSGTYQCTAYHAYDSSTATVLLTVNGEPATTPTSQGQTGVSSVVTYAPNTASKSPGPNFGTNAPPTAVSGQDSNATTAFRVGETANLTCTGVHYDGVFKHWEKNPEIPIKYLVAIQTPLGQSSVGDPFYNTNNIAAAGLTGRFTVTDDLMTATITDVRETDDGDYRCASGPSEIIHMLVAYKLNAVSIQPVGPVTGYVGGTLNITCTTDSKPAASFNWTKQGDSSFTATGATLRISNLTMNDSGTYQCTAYHAYDSRTATMLLTVNGGK
ncbi:cell adhesion molecule CEACAM5-like [Branchiostoma floridae x Branchiostoma japonicum]